MLREAPLLLKFNDLVVVKVFASNIIGSGPESTTNTEGVKIQTEPLRPSNAPVVLSYSEYSVWLKIEVLTNE